MNMSPDQLLTEVIKPVFDEIGEQRLALAVFLTSVAYSTLPSFCRPNFGPYGMTHEQHWEVWEEHMILEPELASKTRGLASQHHFLTDPDVELNLNWGYAVAVAALWCRFKANDLVNDLALEMKISPLLELWESEFILQKTIDKDTFFRIYHRLTGKLSTNLVFMNKTDLLNTNTMVKTRPNYDR